MAHLHNSWNAPLRKTVNVTVTNRRELERNEQRRVERLMNVKPILYTHSTKKGGNNVSRKYYDGGHMKAGGRAENAPLPPWNNSTSLPPIQKKSRYFSELNSLHAIPRDRESEREEMKMEFTDRRDKSRNRPQSNDRGSIGNQSQSNDSEHNKHFSPSIGGKLFDPAYTSTDTEDFVVNLPHHALPVSGEKFSNLFSPSKSKTRQDDDTNTVDSSSALDFMKTNEMSPETHTTNIAVIELPKVETANMYYAKLLASTSKLMPPRIFSRKEPLSSSVGAKAPSSLITPPASLLSRDGRGSDDLSGDTNGIKLNSIVELKKKSQKASVANKKVQSSKSGIEEVKMSKKKKKPVSSKPPPVKEEVRDSVDNDPLFRRKKMEFRESFVAPEPKKKTLLALRGEKKEAESLLAALLSGTPISSVEAKTGSVEECHGSIVTATSLHNDDDAENEVKAADDESNMKSARSYRSDKSHEMTPRDLAAKALLAASDFMENHSIGDSTPEGSIARSRVSSAASYRSTKMLEPVSHDTMTEGRAISSAASNRSMTPTKSKYSITVAEAKQAADIALSHDYIDTKEYEYKFEGDYDDSGEAASAPLSTQVLGNDYFNDEDLAKIRSELTRVSDAHETDDGEFLGIGEGASYHYHDASIHQEETYDNNSFESDNNA